MARSPETTACAHDWCHMSGHHWMCRVCSMVSLGSETAGGGSAPPDSKPPAQQSTDYQRGLADAVVIADLFATENFRLAGDTILTDPVLAGGDASASAVAVSDQKRLDGHMHASMAHAAQAIAAGIRALGSRPDEGSRSADDGFGRAIGGWWEPGA